MYIPTDIKEEISKFLYPKPSSNIYPNMNNRIKRYARGFLDLTLVDCDFYEFFNIKLNNLHIMYYENKYIAYKYPEYSSKFKSFLYDALCTGCDLPRVRYTFNEYTEEIENDIKTMLILDPSCINFALGRMRYRKYITPLAISYYNDNIPVHIVELLFKYGANIDAEITVYSFVKTVFQDIMNIHDRNNIIECKKLDIFKGNK